MLEKIKYLTSRKSFHIVMIIVIIAIILFVVGILVLRYNVEGETNMPFELSKISVISSSGGNSKEALDTKWNYDIYQSNDIYLYVTKNDNYQSSEAISSILINNINVDGKYKDKVKVYKPDSQEENQIFKNEESNLVQQIEYKGSMNTNLKNLEISNQGGLIVFRCLYDNLAEYASNDEVIDHQQLLAKSGVNNEDLKAKLTFDFVIKTESGREYSTNVSLDIPIGDVVGQGTTSMENTDMSQYIFKRIKN